MIFLNSTNGANTVIILKCLWKYSRSRVSPIKRVPGVTRDQRKNWFHSKSCDTYATVWRWDIDIHWTWRLYVECMTPGIGPVGVKRDYEHQIRAKNIFLNFYYSLRYRNHSQMFLKKFKDPYDTWKTRSRCHTRSTIKMDLNESNHSQMPFEKSKVPCDT